MPDDKQMSRRDWFRLRPPRVESETNYRGKPTEAASSSRAHSMGSVPDVLHPIAHPENHDGMDLNELPPMREALLSEEQVRQLFSDIEAHASDILLMQRAARSQRATASKATTAVQLLAAMDTLLSGTVPRVQIRYHWQAADWIDTLERREDGVRLVRIAHTRPSAT